MRIERDWLEQLIFGSAAARRYTQDSPILPDVWFRYGADTPWPLERPVDLLFTPHRNASAAGLARVLLDRIEVERGGEGVAGDRPASEPAELAYNQTAVVARLRFDELLRIALPVSEWWREYVEVAEDEAEEAPDFADANVRKRLARGLAALARAEEARRGAESEPEAHPSREEGGWEPTPELLWLVRLVGVLVLARESELPEEDTRARKVEFDRIAADHGALANGFCNLLGGVEWDQRPPDGPVLFLISVNRAASPALSGSVLAVKADAARRLFKLGCSRIHWAVLDSGIDATHPAFRKRDGEGRPAPTPFEPAPGGGRRRANARRNHTRIIGTYDFTRVRSLLSPEATGERETSARAKRLKEALRGGHAINWSELEPLLEVHHEEGSYRAPVHDHGTHVAGILAADWRAKDADSPTDPLGRATDEDVEGVCPDINLYDLRVFDDHGRGDEFSIMAAIQFIRYLNANRDAPVIHGANLSLSIRHDVANYACGRTPVCEEGERLVASGVVVVVAAGNDGYVQYTTPTGRAEGYRSISITDPGNAEAVITVGATHRAHPHTYGVSYFSSRGPTGDGRVKPDLVAPGEKIEAPVPTGAGVKDGTSMAAPHVSGAAALLMSRHRELIGQPQRVKQVLCATATDLGRERYFQGSGMLDVLRALQHF